MKIKVIAILLVAMLFLSACGTEYAETTATEDVTSKIEATEPTENIIEPTKPTEVETQAETQPLQEEKKEIIIPKPEIVTSSQGVLETFAEKSNVEFKIGEDNIILTGLEDNLNNIAKKYHHFLQSFSETSETIDVLSHIQITEDYKIIEFYIDGELNMDAVSAMTVIYLDHMTQLQLLNGVAIEDIEYTQKFINKSTGELISERVIPEGDKDMAEYINNINELVRN